MLPAEPRSPVFIVGAPRSGTALLRSILNRHSQLAMLRVESHFFRRLYDRRSAFGDIADVRNRARIVSAYLDLEPIRKLGIDTEVLRQRLLDEGVSWKALFDSMLRLYAETHRKPYSGEKTPSHALQADILCEWFPNCAIVHIVRDPRASVRSMMGQYWATQSVWLGTRTWRLYTNAAVRVSDRGNYIRLRYEDLTTQPEREIRRVCSHLGLGYEQTMLQPNPLEAGLPGDRRPYDVITPDTVDLWKEQLAAWQIAAIEVMAAREMKAHGYVRQSSGVPVAAVARAALEVFTELAIKWTLRAPGLLSRAFRPTKVLEEEKALSRSYALYKRVRLRRP